VEITTTIAWLLEGDPAIRWQVQRDLLGMREDEYEPQRQQVASEGWGAALLERQDPETGLWAGGLYGPKWTSTHYTLQLLALMGMPPNEQVDAGVQTLLRGGVRADGGVNYSTSAKFSETCESGMLLAIATSFGVLSDRVERIADYVLREQMTDGGWNCAKVRGARHASLHTTICVLEGLATYWAVGGRRSDSAVAAALRGHEFLAAHRLYRSHTTGEVVSRAMTLASFPPWWHYDVLRGLDYLRSVDAPRDERFSDAIDLIRAKGRKAGTWTRQGRHAGQEWFEMEPTGKPSRWNTLRALRVLRWWDDAG
jgi:hypothetical protein